MPSKAVNHSEIAFFPQFCLFFIISSSSFINSHLLHTLLFMSVHLNKTLKTLTPPQGGKQLVCVNAFTETITSLWKRELSDTRLWGYSHKRHDCAWLHFRKSQFRNRIQYGFCQSSVWGPKSTTHKSGQRKLKTKIKLYIQKRKYKVKPTRKGK